MYGGNFTTCESSTRSPSNIDVLLFTFLHVCVCVCRVGNSRALTVWHPPEGKAEHHTAKEQRHWDVKTSPSEFLFVFNVTC